MKVRTQFDITDFKKLFFRLSAENVFEVDRGTLCREKIVNRVKIMDSFSFTRTNRQKRESEIVLMQPTRRT